MGPSAHDGAIAFLLQGLAEGNASSQCKSSQLKHRQLTQTSTLETHLTLSCSVDQQAADNPAFRGCRG
jgi:hypothetical protein